jgi:hypothetical protein
MKTKYKNDKTYRTGSILALAIVMVVILFIMGMALLELGFGARLNAIIGAGYISARAAADAGIAQALHEMNMEANEPGFPFNRDWTGHTGTAPADFSDSAYGNATYEYEIRGPQAYYEIVSTGRALSMGTSSRATKTVHAALRVITKYDGIWTRYGFALYSGSLVDGYNSADPTDPDTYVKIGTDSILQDAILLNPNCVVDGDVLVGFGGDVDTVIKQQPGAITGPQYPLPSAMPMEENELPPDWAGVAGLPIVFDPCGVATITQSGDYVYDSITLPEGHTLRVGDMLNVANVRIYIAGDLWLKHAAQLCITGIPGEEHALTWSSLSLYLEGNLDGGNSNGINNETLKPGQFRLIGTSTERVKWVIRNGGDFYGVYDAPNADIEIKESGDIYGALIGRTFEQKAKCNIWYDEDLRDPTLWPRGFGISRWWEE